MRKLPIFILMTALMAIHVGAQPYAQTSAWQFANFKDPSFPWDTYRDSFIGIPPTEDALSSAFDVLFYEQVYKSKLAKDGNCFGLALMSLLMLKNGGHMGFCLPVWQYSGGIPDPGTGPTDPRLKRAINVMHGHQVNLPTVQFLLDVFSKHKNRDASYAFTAFQNAHAQNDLTLVSITKSLDPSDGGHTMVAYDAQDLGGGNKRLYVYDPSRTFAETTVFQPYYLSGMNFILINGNSWSFTKKNGDVWAGDPGGGGNIVIVPISVTGPHTRSPASLGDQIIGRILNALFITGDNASVEQVTDARGKHFFRPGTREMDTDPSTGMLSLMPWYPSDQAEPGQSPGLVLFHMGDAGGALSISIAAPESGYTLRVGGVRGQVSVHAEGGRGTDVIKLAQAGTDQPVVAIENRRGTGLYTVELAHADTATRQMEVLRSSNVVVPLGAVFQVAATNRHQELAIATTATGVRYDLELQSTKQLIVRKAVEHTPGQVQTVRPANWSRLSPDEVVESVSAMPARNTIFLPQPILTH